MNKLHEYMQRHHLSQREFAERIGTTQPVINRFARGKVIPGRRLALAIERETGGAVTVASWDQQGE